MNRRMLQSDFTVKASRVILGVSLVCSLLGYSSFTFAQDSSLNQTQQDSSLTIATKMLSPAEGSPTSTLASTDSDTASPSSLLANTQTSTEPEIYPDSLIQPRSNGLNIYHGQRDNANSESTLTPDSLIAPSPESNLPVTVVLYFSSPEEPLQNTLGLDGKEDVDVLSGASLMLTENKSRQSITGYLAQYIAKDSNAQVYELKPKTAYPKEHDALIALSIEQFDQIALGNYFMDYTIEPQLDLSTVDRIFIGFPLWWNDLPLPVYSFLKQTDLAGKTIIPFCTYGHSVPYQFFNKLKNLDPSAKIELGVGINKNRLIKNPQELPRLDSWLKNINGKAK